MRRMAVFAIAAALLVTAPTAASAAGCWRRVAMPDVDGFVEDADFVSATRGLAVGYRLTPQGDIYAVSFRWDGRSWSSVAVPRFSRADYLYGVVMVSGSDAWAVGESRSATLILRWNGSSWRRVSSPHPGNRWSTLSGVARDPRTGAVHAVGFWTERSGFHPLILRWTGARWRTALRRLGVGDVRLSDVTSGWRATWAVGDYGGRLHRKPLILRRTRTGWVRSPVPSAPGSRRLSAVAAAGPDEALAVGMSRTHALMLHWNGRGWRPVPSARVPGLERSASLHDVAMLPSGEAWVTASRSRETGSTDPDYRYHPQAIFHRRAGTWRWERPPKVPYALLTDVSPVTSSDIWAIGAIALEDGGSPLAFRC